MKIVIAPDSFKESLSAREVAHHIKIGFERVYPKAVYHLVPMSDGGEGILQTLIDNKGGKIISREVTYPNGNKGSAQYGLLKDGSAIIELAESSGLELVEKKDRTPLLATTYGFGELIKHALDKGARRIILGLGGSATNDGGAGMAMALGARLLDSYGNSINYGGAALLRLNKIDVTDIHPAIKETTFIAACDVDNILCGNLGASFVFGKQKGASLLDIEVLDNALYHFGKIIEKDLSISVFDIKGGGAAGGLGAGVVSFLGADLQLGIELIVSETGLTDLASDADILITGEGRIDFQTSHGKAPLGVAATAGKKTMTIALCGSIGKGYEVVFEKGIDAVFSCLTQAGTLEEVSLKTDENLEITAENIARTLSYKLT